MGLEEENKRLVEENAALKQRVEMLTAFVEQFKQESQSKTEIIMKLMAGQVPAAAAVPAFHTPANPMAAMVPATSVAPPGKQSPSSSPRKAASKANDLADVSARRPQKRRRVGDALRRNSRTPSRPPERGSSAERKLNRLPLFSSQKEKEKETERLKPPVDLRKKYYTAKDIEELKAVLKHREEELAVQNVDREKDKEGGLIPKLWRPPDSMWERYLAKHGIGETAEPSKEGPRKVQKVLGKQPAKQWVDGIHRFLIFMVLIRPDLDKLPPTTLAGTVKAMTRLGDKDLDHITSSIKTRQPDVPAHSSRPSYSIMTYLYTIILVLVWHSAEGVADALEVCHRILNRQHGSDTIGQAEMLDISSQLSTIDPPDVQVSFPQDCPPYNLPQAAARIESLAVKIRSLLQAKMDG